MKSPTFCVRLSAQMRPHAHRRKTGAACLLAALFGLVPALAPMPTTGSHAHAETATAQATQADAPMPYTTQSLVGHLANTTTDAAPQIQAFLPAENPQKIGVVVLPGGGYAGLADHEGAGYAKALAEHGIAAFVVTYRLGTQGFKHPSMLEDAMAAIGTVREQAEQFGIDPDRIGIMGSSAGGHLAAHLMTAYDTVESDVSLRPDFGILAYPVITSRKPITHNGSMHHLVGDHPSDALLDRVANEKNVTEQTPPCFIWHTVDDSVVPVENALLYAQALQAHHVPFELHIYPKGRHGAGLGSHNDWFNPCLTWIHATANQ